MTHTIYRKVSKLSVADSAYVAGIVDGEGTITLSVKQKGGTRHLAVTVSGTEMSLIGYLLKVISVGRITRKKVYQEHHKQSYTYAVYSRQAIDLLKQITPYLKTYKVKRAKLALKDYIAVTPRNGRYTEDMKKKKEKFVEKFLATLP
jgi:hypothetical protein